MRIQSIFIHNPKTKANVLAYEVHTDDGITVTERNASGAVLKTRPSDAIEKALFTGVGDAVKKAEAQDKFSKAATVSDLKAAILAIEASK